MKIYHFKQNKNKLVKKTSGKIKLTKDCQEENKKRRQARNIAIEFQPFEICDLNEIKLTVGSSFSSQKCKQTCPKSKKAFDKRIKLVPVVKLMFHINFKFWNNILKVFLTNQCAGKLDIFFPKEYKGGKRRDTASNAYTKKLVNIQLIENEVEPKKNKDDTGRSKLKVKDNVHSGSKCTEKNSDLESLEICKTDTITSNLKLDLDIKGIYSQNAKEDEKLMSLKESDKGKDTESKLCADKHSKFPFDFNNVVLDHGFHIRPQQSWSVYMLDSLSIQNLTVIGSIPWAWLREEKWRLHTFAKYPHNTTKSAILLAEAGFAYIGNGKGSDDSVICFFCRKTKEGWREDENIAETHRMLSPNCPMVTGTGSGNIPLIAPSNVSFALQANPVSQISSSETNYSRESIEADGFSEASAGPGMWSNGGQQQQGQEHLRRSAQPKPAVQMATHTVMSPPPPRPDNSRGQIQTNTVIPNQPADESGTARVVTSSNTAPPFSSPEAGSEEGRETQQAMNSTAPASGQSGPGSSSGQPRTESDSSLSASGMGNTQPSSTSANPRSAVSQNAGIPGNGSSTTAAPANQPSTPGVPANQSSGVTSPANQSAPTAPVNPPAVSQNPSYHDLGIITERPKRFEYAVRTKRLETFGDWPRDHHLKKEDLADAGFYFAGYGDCARCFYCGGGLRNWDRDDDVWVEHARWFPKCAFIRQRLGQVFVDTVAVIGRDHEKISFKMVAEKMNVEPSAFQIDSKETPLKHDPAVLTVRDMGYDEKDILSAALALKDKGQMLSADLLYTSLTEKGVPRQEGSLDPDDDFLTSDSNVEEDKTLLKSLKQKNSDLRMQTQCKVCMDREVAVVFLPCGHLVCCTECASAMKDCPVCRKQVKGIVRAFMG